MEKYFPFLIVMDDSFQFTTFHYTSKIQNHQLASLRAVLDHTSLGATRICLKRRIVPKHMPSNASKQLNSCNKRSTNQITIPKPLLIWHWTLMNIELRYLCRRCLVRVCEGCNRKLDTSRGPSNLLVMVNPSNHSYNGWPFLQLWTLPPMAEELCCQQKSLYHEHILLQACSSQNRLEQ